MQFSVVIIVIGIWQKKVVAKVSREKEMWFFEVPDKAAQEYGLIPTRKPSWGGEVLARYDTYGLVEVNEPRGEAGERFFEHYPVER